MASLEAQLTEYLQQEQVDPVPILARLEQVDQPLAQWLSNQCEGRETPLLVGVNGAQGSGKSTFSHTLQRVLRAIGIESLVLSLDDYYLSRAEREVLAQTIHPLLETRGVPGTHNLQRLEHVLQQLKRGQPGETLSLARFDKGSDDCVADQCWTVPQDGLQIVLLEGWCIGALPQQEPALSRAINVLEQEEDATGEWRRFVNQQLQQQYSALFDQLDLLVMLQVPSMEQVVSWRQLQEEKLRACQGRGMTPLQIVRFVSLFERLTRHMLVELPTRAAVLLPIGEDHQIRALQIKSQ